MKKFLLPSFIAFQLVNAQELSPPNFSRESGFYDEEFYLNLSHEDQEAQIIYTLDGSEPDINNLNGRTYQYKKRYPQYVGEQAYEFFENNIFSYPFENDIYIYDRTNDENKIANISTSFLSNSYFPESNVDKSFVVRAKAFKNDETSETVSQVYFINKYYTLPVVNINVDDERLFGYENGLFVAGKKFDDWRLINPEIEGSNWADANYWNSGSSSEVKLNIIYFDNNKEVINQYIGIRNHGNGSRSIPNKSFRLYAKSDYGKKNLSHNFFKDYDYDKFRRLILRNSGQDAYKTIFRDAMIQKLNESLNVETQNYQPIISFINGEYYGIYNIRERYDEKYFDRVFGLEEEEIDFLENEGIVDLGDNLFYLETKNYFKNNDLSNEQNYQQALTYVDEVNYTDYMIAEIYAANYDWPINNVEFFRKKVSYNANALYAHDGRWRWLLKDLDVAFNGDENWVYKSFTHNTLLSSMNGIDYQNNPYTNYIFNGLLGNNNYQNYFVNRFADLMNTIYNKSYVIDFIEVMKEKLSPEIDKHIQRWKLIENKEEWNNQVDIMKEFAIERPTYQKQHLLDYFNLDGTYQLTTNLKELNQGFVKVNTIEINNTTVGIDENYQTWSGEYFQGIPVKLQAIALPGYKFSHWEGDYNSTEQELTINPTNNTNIVAVFEKTLGVGDVDKVDFMVAPNPTTDFVKIITQKEIHHYKIYTQTGVLVKQGKLDNKTIDFQELPNGIYLLTLDVNNQKITKKIIKK